MATRNGGSRKANSFYFFCCDSSSIFDQRGESLLPLHSFMRVSDGISQRIYSISQYSSMILTVYCPIKSLVRCCACAWWFLVMQTTWKLIPVGMPLLPHLGIPISGKHQKRGVTEYCHSLCERPLRWRLCHCHDTQFKRVLPYLSDSPLRRQSHSFFSGCAHCRRLQSLRE